MRQALEELRHGGAGVIVPSVYAASLRHSEPNNRVQAMAYNLRCAAASSRA